MRLSTNRLLLREWSAKDYLPFAEMNADPRVMRFFPNVLSYRQSDALADRVSKALGREGIGFWAIELISTGQFIGTVGVKYVDEKGLPCAPFYEIGWRLAYPFWRKGYAFEAAKRSLNYAFRVGNLPEIYAMTVRENLASRRVMEKLGMENTGKDFQHPEVPKNHACSWHYLYRIKNPLMG